MNKNARNDASTHAKMQWDAAQLTGHNPHLSVIGANCPEVRYLPDGTALVPITTIGDSIDTSLVGIQSISPNGEMRFTEGMTMNGAACAINGPAIEDDVIFITEGYRTACAIRTAMNGSIKGYAAMSVRNLIAAAQAVRKQHPRAHVLVCGERDRHGLLAASAAVEAIFDASMALPEFSKATDLNNRRDNFGDLFIAASSVEVQRQIVAALDRGKQ